MILSLLDEAVQRGARQAEACEALGLDRRTIQRWKRGPSEDQRRGPRTSPANKLTEPERREVLEVVNRPEFRDLPPSQIVPRLADEGDYLASESSIYRILREVEQATHRGRSKPRTLQRPESYDANGPCQVWSWDITYLKSDVRGAFFYLYMVIDVWSRKVVGFEVHDRECSSLASELIRKACLAEGIGESSVLVLHADNGGPMKGSTMLATLKSLGVTASFSRPRVSDDNPYSEALFRTLKYSVGYPDGPFKSLEHARKWVKSFVCWYNTEHRHSAIRFVTPLQRHNGFDGRILAHRNDVYARARRKNPERWTGKTRDWSPIETVQLNAPKGRAKKLEGVA